MKTEIIQEYYRQRGLSWPDHKSALLFYLSEVGELAEAYLAIQPAELTQEEQELLTRTFWGKPGGKSSAASLDLRFSRACALANH